MNKFVLVLIFVSLSEQLVVHKYKSASFDKIEFAGKEALTTIKHAKIETPEQKRYMFNHANIFYQQLSNAVSTLNKIWYSERIITDVLLQDVITVTKDFVHSSTDIQNAIFDNDLNIIKNKLIAAVERTISSIKILSRAAAEADITDGLKIVELQINEASGEILRGFYNMIALQSHFGVTNEQIEGDIAATGLKANAAVNFVTGDKKKTVQILITPARNFVNLLARVHLGIERLFYDEENILNVKDIRNIYSKLGTLYEKALNLKIRFMYEEDGEKLKEELKKLSGEAETLFKDLTKLISGVVGKTIVEEILPQAGTGAQFLFYYLDTASLYYSANRKRGVN